MVRSRGAELGLRTELVPGLQSSLSLWTLRLASELLFVGDAGETEPSRASKRYGIEWNNHYTATPWLLLDADLAVSRARFTEPDPTDPTLGSRIPGSIETLALRQGAAERLREVNANLAAAGLELFVFDAWRPQAVQAYFHDRWLPAELRKRKPHLSDAELAAEVQNYWAAPSTGAAALESDRARQLRRCAVRCKHGSAVILAKSFVCCAYR